PLERGREAQGTVTDGAEGEAVPGELIGNGRNRGDRSREVERCAESLITQMHSATVLMDSTGHGLSYLRLVVSVRPHPSRAMRLRTRSNGERELSHKRFQIRSHL